MTKVGNKFLKVRTYENKKRYSLHQNYLCHKKRQKSFLDNSETFSFWQESSV